MVKPEIIETEPMNMSEVKDHLAKIKKRDGELNYRAKKTEEYLAGVAQLSAKKAKDLFKELNELGIPRLKDTHIHKFIDIMPLNLEDSKVVIQGLPVSINNDNLKKIVDVIDKYR